MVLQNKSIGELIVSSIHKKIIIIGGDFFPVQLLDINNVCRLSSVNDLFQMLTHFYVDQSFVIIAQTVQDLEQIRDKEKLFHQLEYNTTLFSDWLTHKPFEYYSLPEPTEEQQLIPKNLHYCWFGGKKEWSGFERVLESWKEHCPDYDIIRWDESNYNLDKLPVGSRIERGLWSHISDLVRLDVVYEHGGIYLDTDVLLLKPLDRFLYEKSFWNLWGPHVVATGLGFGATKHNETLGEIIQDFNFDAEGYFNHHGLTYRNEIQHLRDSVIFPTDVFSPISASKLGEAFTHNTHAVHLGTSLHTPQMLTAQNLGCLKRVKSLLENLHGRKYYNVDRKYGEWGDITTWGVEAVSDEIGLVHG